MAVHPPNPLPHIIHPIHPSHVIHDIGWYIEDPRCDRCWLSPLDNPLSTAQPCGSPVTSCMWLGREGHYL